MPFKRGISIKRGISPMTIHSAFPASIIRHFRHAGDAYMSTCQCAAKRCPLHACRSLRTASNGFEIHGRMHFPGHCPVFRVICSHGLFSSKDSPKFVAMACQLADRGWWPSAMITAASATARGEISLNFQRGAILGSFRAKTYCRRFP